MAGARQLADIGGLTQGATFGAGQQLQQMGAQQEAAQRRQQAWDYDQWLRGQQGGAQELALAQSFLPGGMQQQWERQPSKWGQIGGGLLGAEGGNNSTNNREGSVGIAPKSLPPQVSVLVGCLPSWRTSIPA
jgi:hypothetical protein